MASSACVAYKRSNVFDLPNVQAVTDTSLEYTSEINHFPKLALVIDGGDKVSQRFCSSEVTCRKYHRTGGIDAKYLHLTFRTVGLTLLVSAGCVPVVSSIDRMQPHGYSTPVPSIDNDGRAPCRRLNHFVM